MTTQTDNTNKGNGDKEHHYDAAHSAIAVKYFTLCQGMNRELAKKQVANLIAGGELKPVEFYNQQIARFNKGNKAQEEKEAKQKANDEAKAAYEKDEAEAKARREEEEKDDSYTLNEQEAALIKVFLDAGATRSTIKGYLKDVCKLRKNQIERALSELMPEKAKVNRSTETFDYKFEAFLFDAIRTDEEIDNFINENASVKQIAIKRLFIQRAFFFNKLHAKYQQA